MKSCVTAFLIALALASGVAGQQPREQLGTVHFATSCNEPAQNDFDRAVALLHSFQFGPAIESFRSTLASDPTCAIAYWGIALSQWGNPFAAGVKDPAQLQAGLDSANRGKSIDPKTERERGYLLAVAKLYEYPESAPQRTRLIAYRDAMERLAAKYPEDSEAQIFYALSIAAAEDPSDKTYAGRLQAGAILEKLFQQQPDHPGLAHYIIHTYDVPALAGRALPAAERYSKIAPDAPHALHMPSHTFTRMGYWNQSITSNIPAAAAAKREGQTGEELHDSDYLVYAYLQTAQDQAARHLLDSLPEIQSRFDAQIATGGAGGPAAGYFALAAIPARYALERRQWEEAAKLTAAKTPFPYADAMTWFARGLGAARLGKPAEAAECAAALQRIYDQLIKANENYWARQVEIEQLEVVAWAALASRARDEALRQMKSAAELEDGTEKNAITPGPLAPAHELWGEMLLELNEPAQAQEQFAATLQKEPRRFRALYGAAKAAQLSGNQQASQQYFRELLKVSAPTDHPGRPELIEAAKITQTQAE